MKTPDYFTIPELPNKPMFRCERRSATLQVPNCARMWVEANQSKSTRCIAAHTSPCKGCPVGAKHAGVSDASSSPITGAPICARCERSGFRMVGAHICVSCWNREREYLIGKNRRGVPPKFHPEMFRASVSYHCDGVVRVMARQAASVKELIVACIRDNSKSVTFGCVRSMNGSP